MVGANIKRLRKQRGIKQHEIAALLGMHRSNYSKVESEQRELSIASLDKIADFFGMTMDEIVHMGSSVPKEVKLKDKTTMERLKLIEELGEEDRSMVFRMLDILLTKKKFKDFFDKHIDSL